MEQLLEELLSNKDISSQDKFYRQFPTININKIASDTIEKVWELLEANLISKDVLYLSLLLHRNIDVLQKLISYDKSTFQVDLLNLQKNPDNLFNYVVHAHKHWFYELISNYNLANKGFTDSIYQNLLYLQIINMTNEKTNNCLNIPLLKKMISCCEEKDIDPFWIYYQKEIGHLIKVVEYCQSRNSTLDQQQLLSVASCSSILNVASEHLKFDNDVTIDLEQFLINLAKCEMPHKEDFLQQAQTLSNYWILAEFIKLITTENYGIDNVNSIVKDIQSKLLNIKDNSLQIELLQLIFALIFTRQEGEFSYVCSEKEIQTILFILKSLIEQIEFRKLYENDLPNYNKLGLLHKLVRDALWRLELVTNVADTTKTKKTLLSYMLAEPECLINLCLKNEDFNRAYQVLQIFGLESTLLARQIFFTEKLQELKQTFKTTSKIRSLKHVTPTMTAPNVKLQFDDIAQEFFRDNFNTEDCQEDDEVIQQYTEAHPILDQFKSANELAINILDLAITQTESFEDSRDLLDLALKHSSSTSTFTEQLVAEFKEIGMKQHLPLSSILLDSLVSLDNEQYKKRDLFYHDLLNLYDQFCQSLLLDEPGVLNKDHPSHKHFLAIIQNAYLEDISSEETVKYLQKLYNYLKAFSKVLYIEKDSSELIAHGKNSPYFNLLTYNRSELMGLLLFQQNLDPIEFERYFGKLKLDFLYHVAGNCFPTVNLHRDEHIAKEELYPENVLYPPNQAVITYIKKRNWLLALILMEMYKVEEVELEVGESRIQHFLNYLRLSKIDFLRPLFGYNDIYTALQHEISFQKVSEFVYSEIGKSQFFCSTHTSNSSRSFETAEEIDEDQLKTTNWKKLFNIISSVPEKQFRKQSEFSPLRDSIIVNLVNDAFECEHYRFAFFIENRNVRTNLMLENMKNWPEDFCIEIIKCELSRFDLIQDETTEELKMWLKHIEHSKKVMKVLEVTTWAHMYEMCAFQPKEVLEKLLFNKEIDLLIEFLEIHEVSEIMLLCVDELFLETAFESGITFSSIKRLFKLLPQSHILDVCKNLLKTLKNVEHLQFITRQLLKLDPDDEYLSKIALSLKMLSVFSQSEFDQQLLFLLNEPLSIVEVLIMNTKLDKLALVIDVIKSTNQVELSIEKIDQLLRCYAEKSLDFRVITQPEPRLLRTPDHKLLQSLDSIHLDPEAQVFLMPRDVPAKEDWVANTEVVECMCCKNVFFSMFNRRHHCRRCGRVICSSCSKQRMIVPSYGDIQVRVCSDCFQQTFNDASSEDTRSTRSVLDDYWILTNDSEHNRIVREEFSYEFAPSVSLCLSLMKFHSICEDYSRFLLNQCDILLKLLIPNQEPLQEIDYLLVIRMLKSLALAAKLASQCTNFQTDQTLADRILTQAELLGLLAERGCLNLLPILSKTTFIDANALRRLTDKLMEREQWHLALEVATKAGIDKSGVFVAWGISCLKAGNLAMAREKFNKCLDKTIYRETGFHDHESKITKNSPLLNEIIKILETKREPIDEDLIVEHQRLIGSGTTLNQSVTSVSQPDGAMFILNKLKHLKNIECGFYSVSKKNRRNLEDVIYNECVYYLNKYGTGISLVEFHIKYGLFDEALQCFIKKRLVPELFVDIYVKCLKEGSVTTLQTQMSEMDPSLTIWKDHLVKVCCHLAKLNLLHSLYQLQLYMGDYVRAAMSCVKFYEDKSSTFTDLCNKSQFLLDSVEHLNQAKEQEQWIAVSPAENGETFEETSITSPAIKKMSQEEIERHKATIKMQIEVSQFLADCENKGSFPMRVFKDIVCNSDDQERKRKLLIPTLFGYEEQRKNLCVLCIISAETIQEGFDMAFRIVQEFKQLHPVKVYKEAAKYFARSGRLNQIPELVACIRNSGPTNDTLLNDMCDEMLILAVATLKNLETSDTKVEELIKLISDKSAKISAYIEAKQLKTAYFLASKHKRLVDLRRIMREAELSNQVPIKLLCQKAIQRIS